MRIDPVGDRDADYAILDLDPVTGKFEVRSYTLKFIINKYISRIARYATFVISIYLIGT